MIELLDIGDRVEIGGYHVFSRFRGATAFVRDEGPDLAVVVEECQGAGPVQLVVRGCDLNAIGSLEVCPDRVILDGAAMEIRRRYRSRLHIGGSDPARIRRNLDALRAALLESAPARSIVFLPGSGSAFEAALAGRFRDGVGLLLAGDLDSGARAIAGLGFGLTPSGDDFLAGLLLGMYAAGAPWLERRRVRQAARSSNAFSESLLRCAADGCCIEPAQSLIHALFAGTEAEVARHTARLSAVGASSGADLAAGVYSFLARSVHNYTGRALWGSMILSCAPVGNRRRAALGKRRQAGYQPAAVCQPAPQTSPGAAS
ncbi:MAG: DUF2877 domain-containing protein [Bryobacteraceae bacterium]